MTLSVELCDILKLQYFDFFRYYIKMLRKINVICSRKNFSVTTNVSARHYRRLSTKSEFVRCKLQVSLMAEAMAA